MKEEWYRQIDWVMFCMAFVGLGVAIIGALNTSANGFQFVGGFLFGASISNLKK